MKNKFVTIGIIIATIVLAGVAVFTAVRLYQLRQEPVAPNVPASTPKAAEEELKAPKACTALTFTLSGTPTPTPTGSPTETPTATPTPTSTPTPTATPTNPPGEPNSCNGTCGSNYNCQSGLFCYQGFCRNPDCPSQTSCSCPGTSTATPGPTATPIAGATPTQEAALPNAGISFPSILGVGLGTILLIGALLLAL